MPTGSIFVYVSVAGQAAPLPGARVQLFSEADVTLQSLTADENGLAAFDALPAPDRQYSLSESNTQVRPYSVYGLAVSADGWQTHRLAGVQVFDGQQTVARVELLPADAARRGVFPCGRLDKHTTGLMFLTDDGAMGHDLLSPRHHVEKIYRFTVKFPLTAEEVVGLEAGAVLEDGYVTKPSRIVLDADRKGGTIALIEGKYHQIKRMMESVHNQITSLERISFGPLTLDGAGLSRGEWRELTSDEVAALEALRGSRRARTEEHDREEKQEE